jgi:hypothetical protein
MYPINRIISLIVELGQQTGARHDKIVMTGSCGFIPLLVVVSVIAVIFQKNFQSLPHIGSENVVAVYEYTPYV